MSCDTTQVHPASGQLDHEQDVERLQPHVSTVKKSDARMPAACWRRTPSTRVRSGGCRAKTVPAKDRSDRRGGDADTKLQKLAADPEVAPTWGCPSSFER